MTAGVEVGVGSRGSEPDVVENPSEGVHARFAAVDGHDHASETSRHRLVKTLRIRASPSLQIVRLFFDMS